MKLIKTKPQKRRYFWAGLWEAMQIVILLVVLVTAFSLIAAM